MLPFYLVTAGALTLILSKVFAGPSAANFVGVFLTLVGSILSTLRKSQPHLEAAHAPTRYRRWY
jgi:hypothetical protein